MIEMSQELYRKYDRISECALICTGLGVVAMIMGVLGAGFDTLYSVVGVPLDYEIGPYIVGFGGVGLCFGGVITFAWATIKRDKYALKPEILAEAIKTLQNGVPKADISWNDCEKKSFEIVKSLIQDGHSGQDLMFMGTRLEYYGLIAAHHEREDAGLDWATEDQNARDDINKQLKAKGYAIVKIDEEEGENA